MYCYDRLVGHNRKRERDVRGFQKHGTFIVAIPKHQKHEDGRGERIPERVFLWRAWRESRRPCDSGQLGLSSTSAPARCPHADWPPQLHPHHRTCNTPALSQATGSGAVTVYNIKESSNSIYKILKWDIGHSKYFYFGYFYSFCMPTRLTLCCFILQLHYNLETSILLFTPLHLFDSF